VTDSQKVSSAVWMCKNFALWDPSKIGVRRKSPSGLYLGEQKSSLTQVWHQVRVPTFLHIYLSSSSARSPFHLGKFLQRKRQECRASLKWEHICCNLSISDRVTRGLSRGHPPKDCPSFQTDPSKTVILSSINLIFLWQSPIFLSVPCGSDI